QNNKKREKHFWQRRNKRRPASRAHRVCRHSALYYKKIRTPVSERQYEAEPHDHAKPFDSQRICVRTAHSDPGVNKSAIAFIGEAPRESVPTANVSETKPHEREETHNDQKELQHLVVNCACEPAQENVPKHDQRRYDYAGVEDPARWQAQSFECPVE